MFVVVDDADKSTTTKLVLPTWFYQSIKTVNHHTVPTDYVTCCVFYFRWLEFVSEKAATPSTCNHYNNNEQHGNDDESACSQQSLRLHTTFSLTPLLFSLLCAVLCPSTLSFFRLLSSFLFLSPLRFVLLSLVPFCPLSSFPSSSFFSFSCRRQRSALSAQLSALISSQLSFLLLFPSFSFQQSNSMTP